MCEPTANGGHRCAAHTRKRLTEATFGTPQWDDAAADHAATPTGRAELETAMGEAASERDFDTEGAIRTALRVGSARREAYLETKRRIAAYRARRREEGIKDDSFFAAEMLACIYSADNIIDRGEALFFEPDNTVEIAAARQHIIDLDTAAEKVSAEFRSAHPGIPWDALARARDRYAHHYDNMNRDIVWNVLIVEFPKIRTILRSHLGD